jgi:hypothetical protein
MKKNKTKQFGNPNHYWAGLENHRGPRRARPHTRQCGPETRRDPWLAPTRARLLTTGTR